VADHETVVTWKGFALLLVVIALFSTVYGYVIGYALFVMSSANSQIIVECIDADAREHVRTLILEGLDQALRNQSVKVFDVWMKDSRESPPRRGLAGMNIATNAYIRARANALNWSPSLCPQ
jgi:hypothetical protein